MPISIQVFWIYQFFYDPVFIVTYWIVILRNWPKCEGERERQGIVTVSFDQIHLNKCVLFRNTHKFSNEKGKCIFKRQDTPVKFKWCGISTTTFLLKFSVFYGRSILGELVRFRKWNGFNADEPFDIKLNENWNFFFISMEVREKNGEKKTRTFLEANEMHFENHTIFVLRINEIHLVDCLLDVIARHN